VSSQIDKLVVRSDPSESIRPSPRSAHRSQLGKAGLERPHQRVDLRFGHRIPKWCVVLAPIIAQSAITQRVGPVVRSHDAPDLDSGRLIPQGL
jgi:hypothetical protein